MTYFIKNNDARVTGCSLELETIAGLLWNRYAWTIWNVSHDGLRYTFYYYIYASKFNLNFFHRILSFPVKKYYNERNPFLNYTIRFHHIICHINKRVIKLMIKKIKHGFFKFVNKSYLISKN